MSDRSSFHPENMRKRFREVAAAKAAIHAASDPIRVERDALVAAHEATRKALDVRLKKAEDGLFELDQELAMLSRALGGKTGPRTL